MHPHSRVRAEENESLCALGIGGSEEDRHRAALEVPEERGALAPDRVHDRAHVVHPRFQVRDAALPVGEARTALVQADESRERRQPLEERRVARLLPVELEVADEPGDEDEIERAVAGHLVGDRDIAALRVANRASHGVILA